VDALRPPRGDADPAGPVVVLICPVNEVGIVRHRSREPSNEEDDTGRHLVAIAIDLHDIQISDHDQRNEHLQGDDHLDRNEGRQQQIGAAKMRASPNSWMIRGGCQVQSHLVAWTTVQGR
jgi:hypothetical protein